MPPDGTNRTQSRPVPFRPFSIPNRSTHRPQSIRGIAQVQPVGRLVPVSERPGRGSRYVHPTGLGSRGAESASLHVLRGPSLFVLFTPRNLGQHEEVDLAPIFIRPAFIPCPGIVPPSSQEDDGRRPVLRRACVNFIRYDLILGALVQDGSLHDAEQLKHFLEASTDSRASYVGMLGIDNLTCHGIRQSSSRGFLEVVKNARSLHHEDGHEVDHSPIMERGALMGAISYFPNSHTNTVEWRISNSNLIPGLFMARNSSMQGEWNRMLVRNSSYQRY